jgi:hypothetical protein
LKGFIKKQNDPDDIPFEIDYYEQKSKELIRKYSQHDEHSKEKGLIFNLFFDILRIFLKECVKNHFFDIYLVLII